MEISLPGYVRSVASGCSTVMRQTIKFIAVLKHDATYNVYNDISELPHIVVDRLKHYFLTYKDMPGEEGQRKVEITHVYGREEAYEVIRRSLEDYKNHFEGLEDILSRV